eukprot:1158386-Pelagomonas_calceolata.AAC.8
MCCAAHACSVAATWQRDNLDRSGRNRHGAIKCVVLRLVWLPHGRRTALIDLAFPDMALTGVWCPAKCAQCGCHMVEGRP